MNVFEIGHKNMGISEPFDIGASIVDCKNRAFTMVCCDCSRETHGQVITIIFHDKKLIIDQAVNWRANATAIWLYQNIDWRWILRIEYMNGDFLWTRECIIHANFSQSPVYNITHYNPTIIAAPSLNKIHLQVRDRVSNIRKYCKTSSQGSK